MYFNHSKTEKLVHESEVEVYDKLSFKRFVDDKRIELEMNVGTGRKRKCYPLKDIAKNLGLSIEMFQKRINKEKPTRSRDCIIAICAALGCDSFDTNEALIMYDYMPTLDPENPRESFLIDALSKLRGEPADICLLNCQLKDLHFPVLNIIDHRGKEKEVIEEIKGSFPYKVQRRVLRTYLDEGDQYDSLETAYGFRYRCLAAALLEVDGDIKYVLKAHGEGYLSVETKGLSLPKSYKDISKTGEFKDYFSELIILAKQEQRRVDNQVYDSKNYQSRLGANIKNDTIHVFYEQYNYVLPERNEYYLMEYVDGHLKLSVSHQSMFMSEYLSEEEYKKHYITQPKIVSKTFDSLDDIQFALDDRSLTGYYRDILIFRKYAFKKFSKIIDDALTKIKNRELFIRNLEMIWDNHGVVCRYYGLESEFDCSYDDEYDEIILGKDLAVLTDENGHQVEVSFDELKRAFELGFVDVSQICRVKTEKGSVESIL